MAEPAPDQRGELEAILQAALEFGVRVQMAGGYTARVRSSMQHVATALGAERAESWVSSGSVGLVVHRGGWSRTSVRTTPAFGVNFTELSELSRLVRRTAGMTVEQFRDDLADIAGTARRYPVPLVLAMLGVSCASFAGLFGADPAGIALAGLGGLAGATVRRLLVERHFKPFVYCFAAALVAASVVLGPAALTDAAQSGGGLGALGSNGGGLSSTVEQAVTASILFLVPGVPLLNGSADLLTSNYLNGLVRLTRASVILLGAAMGLAASLLVWGWG